MHIAIRKRSELKMLRQINPFLTRYKIPREVLNRVEGIFTNKDLGKDGYVAIILEPINDDCSDVMEELNLDYTLVDVPDNNYYQIPVKGKKHPMKRKRQWNSYDTEAEATDAMEYLKKKEYEEYYGKESSFSKISKGLGSLFKK